MLCAMSSTTVSVAAAVRAELARVGISGRQLARDMGWTPAYLGRRLKLNNPRPFRVDELARIAEHLGVPLSRLYGPDAELEGRAS